MRAQVSRYAPAAATAAQAGGRGLLTSYISSPRRRAQILIRSVLAPLHAFQLLSAHVFHRRGKAPWTPMPRVTSPCAEYNCDAQTVLTFTPMDWYQSQTVLVQAVNDDTEEPAVFGESYHVGRISHESRSSDPQYDDIVLPNITNHIEEGIHLRSGNMKKAMQRL